MSTRSEVFSPTNSAEPKNPTGLGIEGGREWIYGFLLLGVLLGITGSILIAWQYHIGADPALIGIHFLSLNAGYVVASLLAIPLSRRFSFRKIALAASALATFTFVSLSFAAPPAAAGWRIFGLGSLGFSAGLLASALLHVLDSFYTKAPSYAANLTGALFGCGSTLATVVIAMTYFAGSVQLEVGLLGLVPAIFFILFWRTKFAAATGTTAPSPEKVKHWQSLRDVRSIAAVLFSLLLFFQFGNECVVGGWLALQLVQRLGVNPAEAVFCLASYFLALTAARLGARWLLPYVNTKRLLYASILVSMAGYGALTFAPDVATACAASVVLGFGYAPIYPVIAETLDHRFSYHPGFYQGVFSIAITGAMSAPWLVGYLYGWLGTESVMLLPAFGSVAVLVLALLIRLEARLMKREASGGSTVEHG